MPDLLDEIIDILPPATLKMIMDYKSDSSVFASNLNNSLNLVQQIKINRTKEELEREIMGIKSKTAENRKLLSKLQSDLKVMELEKNKFSEGNQPNLKPYIMKIKEFEKDIQILTKKYKGVDLTQLFKDIEDLNEQILEYKKKIAEAKSTHKCYEDFPPDINQAKKTIENLKEQIKSHESNTFIKF